MDNPQTHMLPFLAKIYAGRQRHTEAESVQGDGLRQLSVGASSGTYAAVTTDEKASRGEAPPAPVRRDGMQYPTLSVDICPDAQAGREQLNSAATGQKRPNGVTRLSSARASAAATVNEATVASKPVGANEETKRSLSTPISALTSAVAAMTGSDNAESATTSNNETAISSRASNASSNNSAITTTSSSTATTASSSTSEPALDFATDSSLDGFSSSESVASSSSATTGTGRGRGHRAQADRQTPHKDAVQGATASSKRAPSSPAFRSAFQIYGPASPLTSGTGTGSASSSSYYYSPTMPFYMQSHPVQHQPSHQQQQQQHGHHRHHQTRHGSVSSYDSSSTGRGEADIGDKLHSSCSSATTSPAMFDSLAHQSSSHTGHRHLQLLPLTLPPPSLDLPTTNGVGPWPSAPGLAESKSHDTIRKRISGAGALRDVYSEPAPALTMPLDSGASLTASLPFGALSPSVSAASASTAGTSPGGFSTFSYVSTSTSSPSNASTSGAFSPPFPTPTLHSVNTQDLQGHDNSAKRDKAVLKREPQNHGQRQSEAPQADSLDTQCSDKPAPFAAFPHLPIRPAPAFTRQSSASTSYSRSSSPGPVEAVPLLCPPDNFAMVAPAVYRSSFPSSAHYPFLRSLKLRTVLTLVQDEYSQENASFFEGEGIQFFQIGIPGNKEPFVHIPDAKIRDAIKIVLDKRNHPIMIHCNKGKHRTGCLVGCLRKMQCWSSTAIFEEYRKFSFPKSRAMDQLFIELYQPDWACLAAEELPEWCKEEDGGLAGRSEEYLLSHSAAASPAFGSTPSKRTGHGRGKARECEGGSPATCERSRDNRSLCNPPCLASPMGAQHNATPSRCTSPLCTGEACSTPKGRPKVRLKESWVDVKIGSTIPDDEDPSETEEDDL